MTSKTRVMILGFRCLRCFHVWAPNKGTVYPKACGRCKSPLWDKPRTHPQKRARKHGPIPTNAA